MLPLLLAAALAVSPDQAATDGDSPAERAQRLVAERMKDPAALQFRDVAYNAAAGIACGQVNAKNAFGGYVGYQDFIVKGDFVLTRGEASAALQPLFDEAWRQCRGGTEPDHG
ncbi:TPA: hypothetical protein ACOFDH_000487 [Stenotrophomonas maltophilia]|uniref:hypothetical protein n=1 Tax=Stenotrophomonas muris TaxID=2963283 RepID=UPI0012FD11FF